MRAGDRRAACLGARRLPVSAAQKLGLDELRAVIEAKLADVAEERRFAGMF